MNKLTKVSIIIPVFNGEKTIRAALESCLAQTYHNLEILVIDNGSTDSTSQIVKKIQKNDGRIKYIFTREKGRSTARNKGIQMAKGSFIQFLDADDTINFRKIKISMDLIGKNSNLDGVQTGTRFIKNGKIVDELLPYQKNDCWNNLCLHNTIPINSMLIKKTKCAKFTPKVDHCEDWNFWLNSLKDANIGYITDILATVNIHNNNTMSDFTAMKTYEIWNYLEFIDRKIGFIRSIKRIIFVTCDIAIYKSSHKKIDIIEESIRNNKYASLIGYVLNNSAISNSLTYIYKKRFNKGKYEIK